MSGKLSGKGKRGRVTNPIFVKKKKEKPFFFLGLNQYSTTYVWGPRAQLNVLASMPSFLPHPLSIPCICKLRMKSTHSKDMVHVMDIQQSVHATQEVNKFKKVLVLEALLHQQLI